MVTVLGDCAGKELGTLLVLGTGDKLEVGNEVKPGSRDDVGRADHAKDGLCNGLMVRREDVNCTA